MANENEQQMREVLQRAENVLKNPDSAKDFFQLPVGQEYVMLEGDTLEQWDIEYNLSKRIVDGSSHLYVQEDFDGDVQGDYDKEIYCVRLNLTPEKLGGPKIIKGVVSKFNPDGMKIGFLPRFYDGRRSPNLPVDNPFIIYKFLVFDNNDRRVLDEISGTNLHNSLPVFSPHNPLSISCWFDVHKTRGEKTSLEVSLERDDCLIISTSLHKPEEIGKLTLPDSRRAKHFFDVAYSYMKK